MKLTIILLFLLILANCNGYDDNYFPYKMIGLNVWVYDENTREAYNGGRINASYWERKGGLIECQIRASLLAKEKHLENWSYVCCTITNSSDCTTKVR